jgi:hypothetical protein
MEEVIRKIGATFWIERKTRRDFHSIFFEISGAHKYRGAIPLFKIKANNVRVVIFRLIVLIELSEFIFKFTEKSNIIDPKD